MAIIPQDLRADETDIKNIMPLIRATELTTVQFAAGAVTLPAGTPLSYTAGTDDFAKFTVAGATVNGIVWPNDVVLNAAGEVMGTIMLKGEVMKFSEIEALVEAADRVALKAQCKDVLPSKGIIVREIGNLHI